MYLLRPLKSQDMGRAAMLLPLMLSLFTAAASAAVVEHTFNVSGMMITQLCTNTLIYTANQQLPGPTIEVNDGDTLAVHVVNGSPYPLSLHWHGIFQMRSGWNDGASMITQCPIQPNGSFTYRFNVTGQEGTLWWHAHSSLLRATIHGALIVKPKNGTSGYPYPAPYDEIPIVLGEWWNKNVDDVEKDAYLTGVGPELPDAVTINGMPGDQTPCRGAGMYQVEVEYNKTYLLRIINAAVNVELFFKVAGHAFTVVAADASYTKPYDTNVIVVAPGQTVDALMNTTAPAAGRYYMAAHVFESKTVPQPFVRTAATGIVKYKGAPDNGSAAMPTMPAHTDTFAAGRFYWSLTGLAQPGAPAVPTSVNHSMVVTFGLDTAPCAPDQTKCSGFSLVAAMNRNAFQFPKNASLLEAHHENVTGVYTDDFPDFPPPVPGFRKSTSVKKLNYGDVVEVVLQSEEYSRVLGTENHPVHLHGFDFFLLAQGLGRFDATRMKSMYNLVDPQVRNTVAVPAGGWAVVRFTANNPGMWFMHCHLDAHLPLGLAMVFEVLDGPAPNVLPPPPAGYPKC